MPFCATGKQPSFPEEPKSQVERLPTDSLELLLKKLNKIFKDTGCPALPLALLWLVLILTLIFNFWGSFGDSGQQVLRGIGILWAIILTVCQTKRRKKLARTLQHWNRSDGVTYGIHLAMGGKDGARLSACRCGKPSLIALNCILNLY